MVKPGSRIETESEKPIPLPMSAPREIYFKCVREDDIYAPYGGPKLFRTYAEATEFATPGYYVVRAVVTNAWLREPGVLKPV